MSQKKKKNQLDRTLHLTQSNIYMKRCSFAQEPFLKFHLKPNLICKHESWRRVETPPAFETTDTSNSLWILRRKKNPSNNKVLAAAQSVPAVVFLCVEALDSTHFFPDDTENKQAGWHVMVGPVCLICLLALTKAVHCGWRRRSLWRFVKIKVKFLHDWWLNWS